MWVMISYTELDEEWGQVTRIIEREMIKSSASLSLDETPDPATVQQPNHELPANDEG